MTAKTEMVSGLRKLAQALREQSDKVSKKKIVKCAQVLTAAQGLTRLREVIQGGSNEQRS